MVEERLNLELEVQEIFQSIDAGRNFLLSGGAGSGKTYSLVSVIRQAILENPTAKVACMTYTNAAVKEIEERVNHKNLNVSTIHDFLWDNIKHFQKELKVAIIALANDEEVSRISIDDANPIPNTYYEGLEDGIQYKEYVRLRDGIISHDELLLVANYLFDKYPKLSSIVKDKFQFIFIDEYQDTSKAVVDTFLTHFKKSERKNIIGFFGDAMQSIYEDGIGNLDEYKGQDADKVKEILKKQNRRNPQLVINLANKLRTDGIIQEPSIDINAPNMVEGLVKQGTVLFLYSTDGNIEKVEKSLRENYGWDFNNTKQTKELNLTHNLIASKAGFRELMDIYDSDPIIGLKTDILNKIKDNKKNNRPEIAIDDNDTFDVVVDKFQLKNIQRNLKKDILLADPIKAELYNQLKDKLFSEVRKIYMNKDALTDDKKQDKDDENKKGSKRDNLIKHLFKIQNSISLYKNKQYNEFLRVTDYRIHIRSIANKRLLKENIDNLINVGEKTIEEVITDAHEKGISLIDDRLLVFKEKNQYLYNRVKDVKFNEFQKLYEYLEGQTPFSTQHKTKGAEFDNVLVILDNGGWNNYNFEKMFLGTATPSVLERTQKLFYVCCTRAKENLAVFFHNPDAQVIAKANGWFGNDNVINID
ncbi:MULTISPECIES: UvrD-helicase domain-containing protein [Bacteroidota]|uniref:ATP-dependent helicase n=2 Tax=Flavobacterium TaxID=237 RepID=A0A4R5CP48_9FLAO|nr:MULTISPECIES: UvrD-helicase domain-containing protein [Bacteroidota]TDD74353.1 ATP-dependent helicase [Flavobacterium caseinilyticum]TDE00541.1 ATP-dependent helicase [Flavobacterium sandaracinum]SDM47055.1 DNA helicase-2 / ATP-dependent DNA helicase PcrA [Pedobacter antarcticus]